MTQDGQQEPVGSSERSVFSQVLTVTLFVGIVFSSVIFFFITRILFLLLRRHDIGEAVISTVVSELSMFFGIFSILSIVILLMTVRYFAKYMFSSLGHLQRVTAEISEGNFDVKVNDIASADEFGELAESVDRMRKRLRSMNRKMQKEIERKTRILEEKVRDLERIRNLTADSELYAAKMKRERDEAKAKMASLMGSEEVHEDQE
ncbi:MAG: HAMP domain-containing protein [Nanoarchaeota archaeon]